MTTVLLLLTTTIFSVLIGLLTLNLTRIQNAAPIPLEISISFKVAKPTSCFQTKLDIWSQQSCYDPLKWHNPHLGRLWSLFCGTESGSLSQMHGTGIQVLLCPRTFNLTSHGKSLTTTLVRIRHLYIIVLIIQSPLPYHSCSSQNFFFKIKVDLSWERSGIYNLGVGCILTNFSYWKVSPLPSSSLNCLYVQWKEKDFNKGK